MTTRKSLNIGLFGFGCVGQGLYNVLQNSTGIQANITKICVKDGTKKRHLDNALFTLNKNDILNDSAINLVVELINNADDAFAIVATALKNGKDVVTANKKMIAEHYRELIQLQEQTGQALLYEASACGSIPIIRTLEEYYDNETLNGVSGIFNGTSNFILTKIFTEGIGYSQALAQAQELGFAEIDPTLDVDGYDAKYKLQILSGHSYGVFTQPNEVLNLGIRHIQEHDFALARNLNAKIKLIAHAGKINEEEIGLYVLPELIGKDHLLYNVENENNGVIVEASFSDKQLFIGKGAGGNPTGSAVLSDISAGSYAYKYEYKKRTQRNYSHTNNIPVTVLLSGDRIQAFTTQQTLVYVNSKTALLTTTVQDLIQLKPSLEENSLFVAVVKDETLLLQLKELTHTVSLAV